MRTTKKIYWHEIKDNVQFPIEQWNEVIKQFSKPDWCCDDEALTMGVGCMNLIFKRHKISELFCEGCNKKKGENFEIKV